MFKNVRYGILSMAAATLLALLPSTSEAQIGVRVGRGGGYGGYGGYYGRGFYGPGYGPGYGTGYGYGRGFYGPGVGVNIGRGGYYGGYSTNTGGAILATPGVAAGPTVYQSQYPPDATVPASTDGRGSITVNVPPNAQVWWNGSPSSLTGPTRFYSTLPLGPDGAMQRFEARWTDASGQAVAQSREVRAMPNQTVTVDFNQPDNVERSPAAK